jgi:RHS repeat-associated protein
MFHHFPEEPEVGADCLVRSTAFTHQPGEAVGELLTSAVQHGHRRDGDGYLTRSLPPLELGYSPATLHDEVREIDADSLAGAPAGLAGDGYQWVDLDGEGIAGILAAQGSAWHYKPGLGGARFGPTTVVSPVPATVGSDGARVQLLDLAGDGQRDAAVFAGPTPGFFTRREHGRGWEEFVAFDSLPAVDWDDPRLRFVDLNGDGHSDLLITEDDAITWYPSRGKQGFEAVRRVSLPAGEERGPRLVHADATGSIQLADMSGDGMADLVRIRNGEVCYWPNLGYGRFGAKVTMDDPPWFDHPERFDPRFLRLADVDGSGITDLIYLGHDGARIYLNRSGNGWTPPHLVTTAPRTDNRTQVAAVDLLGTGTTCLVWSSDRPEDSRRSLRYIDLLGSAHPHLVVTVVDNLGAETRVGYAPSTRFYLADRAAGRPWLTRLPFPVQVVERVTTLDRVSRNRFVTRYAYHHGHFDGQEREFRGFGMVEQWDTEELSAAGADVDFDASNEDSASRVPPVFTKTWFHTGMFAGRGQAVSRQFEAEYWREPGLTGQQQRALLLADTHWPEVLRLPDGTAVPHLPTAEEVREACRALKGSMLRQEVYALDGSEADARPYQVTENSYTVELLQPKGPGDRHAVCLAYPRETASYRYERKLYQVAVGEQVADPRVSHEATLDVDGFGNVLRAVTVGYGRRRPAAGLDALPPWAQDAVREEQARPRAMLTVNGYTDPIDEGEHYRAPMQCESRGYELLGVAEAAGAPPALFSLERLRELADAAGDGEHDLPYEDVTGAGASTPGPHRRLVEHVRTLYLRDDLTGPLPLGRAQPRGLLHETRQLALTLGLVAQVYRRTVDGVEEDLLPDPPAVLEQAAGYLADDGGWWLPSGQPGYLGGQFFLPETLRDAFGNITTTSYDRYHLLVRESRDPLGNLTTATNDYRVLQPWQVTDPNRNRSQVAFDALGMVAGTAVLGKPEEERGDTLAGFQADLPQETVAAHAADPLADPHAILGRATSRLVHDLFAYHRTRADPQPQPAAIYTLTRDTHDADLPPGQQSPVRHAISYMDGFEREIQRKVQAEPGPVIPGGPDAAARWAGTGWTVFDNHGNPVRRYEPFFTETHRFENEKVAGVSPVLCYDPLGRLVATLAPDDTYLKVVFDPWREAAWDGNDTVLLDPRTDPDVGGHLAGYLVGQDAWQSWHARRATGALGERERQAAEQAAGHAGTPAVAYSDPLGRPLMTVQHNRFARAGETVEERHATRTVRDIEGNGRAIVDPLGRVVVRHDYDLLGNQLRQASMEAGERWSLADVAGKPLYRWDSRGHRLRISYDPLRRPTGVHLSRNNGPEVLVGATSYGESHPDPAAENLRGKVHQIFDGAGVVTNEAFDFKGNLLRSSRQLAVAHRAEPDWSGQVPLEPSVYSTRTSYDAQNRPVTVAAPDGSVVRYGYNEANLLERVEANLRGAETATVFVADLDYDPKGQRTLVVHGNGARTSYAYDPATFRLTGLRTERGGERLRDLSFTYDPVGNLTYVRDAAQPEVFFRNQRVGPDADYTYDATYRLVQATGREHLGQVGPVPTGPDDAGRVGLAHPGDGAAMGRYRERYEYDPAGNLLALRHRGSDPDHPGWTREYDYQEASLLEPGQASNRLSQTRIGSAVEPYAHDRHGNLTAMPHLSMLQWSYLDQLQATAAQAVEAGTPETTWYVYDAGGERVRKVTDRAAAPGQPASRKAERIYLGGFEIYREYGGDGATVAAERETLHIKGDTQHIALVETQTAGTSPAAPRLVRYQLGNQVGACTLELDGDAQIISYEEYYPYGGTSYQAVRAGVEAPKRYRYAGKERDEESGLCYHGARYYAPWLARWTSPDPAGTADGPNLYVYVRDRPTTMVDPDGGNGTPSPTDFATFEEYSEAMPAPWTEEYKEEQWAAAVSRFDQNVQAASVEFDPAAAAARQHQEDLRRLQQVRTPLLAFVMPSHIRHTLRDQSIGIQNPYLRFQAQVNQRGGMAVAQFTNRLGMATVAGYAIGMGVAVGGLLAVKVAGPALLAGGQSLAAAYSTAGMWIGANYPTATAIGTTLAAGLSGVSVPAAPAAPAARSAVTGVWSLNQFARGRLIERVFGANLPGQFMKAPNFPTIDKFVGGSGPFAQIITSIKSLDVRAASYQTGNAVFNRLNQYIASLARFTQATRSGETVRAGPATQRVLEVFVSPGASQHQLNQLQRAAQEAARQGIQLNVSVVQ